MNGEARGTGLGRWLAAALLALAAAAAPAHAADRVLGADDAPVTIIEFASMSCPHCARFHNEILPWLEETYIAPGKVRLVFRDFPLNAPAVFGAAAAHCAGAEGYFAAVALLYRRQRDWAFGDDPKGALLGMAGDLGIAPEALSACLDDQALQDEIIGARKEALEVYEIKRTPTLVVGDEVHGGVPSREDLAQMIAAAGG